MKRYIYRITISYENGEVLETYTYKKRIPKRLKNGIDHDTKAIKASYKTIKKPSTMSNSEHVEVMADEKYRRRQWRECMKNCR